VLAAGLVRAHGCRGWQAAQASGATLTLTSALLPRWRDAAANGHADDDLSAVYLTS
jgi:3-hydroxyisobutyrate dehydrogenase-like beta-hydroxyacid dehydrogenase